MAAARIGLELNLVGMVGRLRSEQHGGQQVREFVVTTSEGVVVPVELRGERISGVLGNGDRVKIAVPEAFMDAEDRTQRPLKLRNVTTGGVVVVFRDGLLRHAARAGLKTLGEAWKTAVGVLVGGLLVYLGVNEKQGVGLGIAPMPEQWDASVLVWLLVGSLPVIALIGYFAVYRPWRWRGGPLPVWRLANIWVFTWAFCVLLWAWQRSVTADGKEFLL